MFADGISLGSKIVEVISHLAEISVPGLEQRHVVVGLLPEGDVAVEHADRLVEHKCMDSGELFLRLQCRLASPRL